MVKANASLKDTAGVITDNVTIWGSWPGFSDLMTGHIVEGEIEVKQNGKYTNKTLVAPKPVNKTNISQAQDRKREMIEKAQEDKQDGIQISATFRDATLLTIALAEGRGWDSEELKEKWLAWRRWLLENWNVDKRDLKSPF